MLLYSAHVTRLTTFSAHYSVDFIYFGTGCIASTNSLVNSVGQIGSEAEK